MATMTEAAQDPKSQAEVEIDDKACLARWSKALGVTDGALVKAVQEVGPRIDRIKDYLGAGGMAGDQEDA